MQSKEKKVNAEVNPSPPSRTTIAFAQQWGEVISWLKLMKCCEKRERET